MVGLQRTAEISFRGLESQVPLGRFSKRDGWGLASWDPLIAIEN
jgi:hypothetical protein